MPEDTKPNDVQIGGEHYRAEFQHWDLMIAWDVHYLLAASTKYVCRWRQKGGYQDLEKAMHYLDKMIEAVEAGKLKPHHSGWDYNDTGICPGSEMLEAWGLFQEHNEIDEELFRFIYMCISWEELRHLHLAKAVLVEYMELHKDDERPGNKSLEEMWTEQNSRLKNIRETLRYDRARSIDIDPSELV